MSRIESGTHRRGHDMRIYLLRHGTADPRGPDGPPDEERRLVEKGTKQCRDVARLVRRMGLSFDTVLSSPRTRAIETAEAVIAAVPLDNEVEAVPFLDLDVMANVAAAELVARKSDSLLAVGHEPQLSAIAMHLAGNADIVLKKGGLVELAVFSTSPPRAELLGLIRPGHL